MISMVSLFYRDVEHVDDVDDKSFLPRCRAL